MGGSVNSRQTHELPVNNLLFAHSNSDWRKKTVPACCQPTTQHSQALVPDAEAHFWVLLFSAFVLMQSRSKVVTLRYFCRYFAHVSVSVTYAIHPQKSYGSQPDWINIKDGSFFFFFNSFLTWAELSQLSQNQTWERPQYRNTHEFTRAVHLFGSWLASERWCRPVFLKMAECKSWEF